jgi:hypothetical protein
MSRAGKLRLPKSEGVIAHGLDPGRITLGREKQGASLRKWNHRGPGKCLPNLGFAPDRIDRS